MSNTELEFQNSSQVSEAQAVARPKGVTDLFEDPCGEGRVVGSLTKGGVPRGGVDREGVLSIDHGALRIQPMIDTGWGKAGLSYGAYSRQNGLALAVFMLNGHNTAQVQRLEESLRDRLRQWLVGSKTERPAERALQWLKSGRVGRTLRQIRWWNRIRLGGKAVDLLDENLAVGWFTKAVPGDPVAEGNAFVMHATGGENGELWANVGTSPLPTIRGVQNLQIYYVVVLRERGAAYYAASIPSANGMSAFPVMRPLAIDAFNEQPEMYPGVHQSALGQIGFRLDTRVYGVRVEQLPEYSRWFGSAQVADLLQGTGNLGGSSAETGGRWRAVEGDFARDVEGAKPLGVSNVAVLEAKAPAGLVHVICSATTEAAAAGLIWRYQDATNYWRMKVSASGCQLSIQENGEWQELAADAAVLTCGEATSIQLLDDGVNMSFYLGARLLFGSRFQDARLQDAAGVGLLAGQEGISLGHFEAHARTVALPEALRVGEPWLRKGANVAVADDFQGAESEVEGRTTPVGGKVWKKQMGAGSMRLNGEGGLQVQASVARPNPYRTAYTVEWDHPGFADVSVEITPPGTAPDQKQHGTSGFILWQDADNYIAINCWMNGSYPGSSTSCFFHLDGFEDVYDAVWSNVGRKIYFGRPFRFRVVFDGLQYVIYVDDEPVLYRAVQDIYRDYPRFSIRRVGLLANWEWGNDTGSMFRDFVAKV